MKSITKRLGKSSETLQASKNQHEKRMPKYARPLFQFTARALSVATGITCLGFFFAGCEVGSATGTPIAGCPDGAVEYLAVSAAGEIEHREGKFLELVDRSDQKLVIVDCWATWCGPCVAMAPHLEQIRKDWGDKIDVVKVDVDKSPEIAAYLRINSIPDIRIFRNGTQVSGFVGLRPRQEIEALLRSLE